MEMALYVKNNAHNFVKNSYYHTYNTRNKDSYSVPIHALTTFERSPVYMGTKVYNALPVSVRRTNTVSEFKRELMLFLKKNVFYTLDELYSHSAN